MFGNYVYSCFFGCCTAIISPSLEIISYSKKLKKESTEITIFTI
jgi:hypothetical protein